MLYQQLEHLSNDDFWTEVHSENFIDPRSLKTIHFNNISAFVNSEPNDMELGYKIRQYFNETVKPSLEELKNSL